MKRGLGTDNQEKDEKQSQNDKTGLGMEKTVKDKDKSKPESIKKELQCCNDFLRQNGDDERIKLLNSQIYGSQEHNKCGPVVAGNQTNGIARTRDNIVTGPKDSEEDSRMKPIEVDKSRASNKDGEDDQATRSDTVGPSCIDDDLSSPVNAAKASNAFEEHLLKLIFVLQKLHYTSPVFKCDFNGRYWIFGNA
ncbi:hypothetical protein Tco_1515825 [Tanacetum coccineum]